MHFLSECKCGLKNAADRIVNGNPADANEYPWQVGLKNGYSSTYCGGTLISSCHVLTAAHCFDSGISSNLAVALGDNDHMDLNEPTDVSCPRRILFCHVHLLILSTLQNLVKVAKVTRHPDYNKDTYSNDFAILTLADCQVEHIVQTMLCNL